MHIFIHTYIQPSFLLTSFPYIKFMSLPDSSNHAGLFSAPSLHTIPCQHIQQDQTPNQWVHGIKQYVLTLLLKWRRRSLSWWLLFWVLVLIVSSAGVQIYLKSVLNFMPDYQYFVFQSGTLAFLPLSGAVVVYKLIYTEEIRVEMLAWLWLPAFAVMALLDSLEDFAVVIASNHSTLAIQTLAPQAILPLTMVLSYFILKARYNLGQIFGALLILAGVVLAVLPLFLEPDPNQQSNSTFFCVIIVLANLPGALSSIYKQTTLQDKDMDVFYLNTMITLFQIVINVMLAPVNAIPDVGGEPISQIPGQFRDGVLCLFNQLSDVPPTDDCSQVLWRWIMFVFCVFISNTALLYICKLSGASFLYVASAVSLPLITLLGTSATIMGGEQYTTPLSNYTIGGLVGVIIGLLVYAIAEEAGEVEEEPVAEKQEIAKHSTVSMSPTSSGNVSALKDPLIGSRKKSEASFSTVFGGRFGLFAGARLARNHEEPALPPRDARVAYLSRLGISSPSNPNLGRKKEIISNRLQFLLE